MNIKEKTMNKIFIMLIGIPASGKTFFVKNTLPQLYPNDQFAIISSDDILERIAKEQGKTYSEIFKDEAKNAIVEMNMNFRDAVFKGENIVWDQTNLTVKSRRGKISQLPKDYYKIAVVMKLPDKEELEKRLNSRPGKFIPKSVIDSMISQLTLPTIDEGFNKIINY